jgi:alpha-mannosidase
VRCDLPIPYDGRIADVLHGYGKQIGRDRDKRFDNHQLLSLPDSVPPPTTASQFATRNHSAMTCDDLVVLVPCHSLEDFPTELGEKPAEGLMNAYAALWHPALIAAAGAVPRWARADEPLEIRPGRVVVVPSQSNSLVSSEWVTCARQSGLHVVTDTGPRADVVRKLLEPFGEVSSLDADVVADFLAFGHLHLQTELLTRKMRHFGDIDHEQVRREGVAGAKALVAGDSDAARVHLRRCFERLQEARERFYPVQCYLIDLCLVMPGSVSTPLRSLLETDTPLNLMGTARDWEAIAREQPDVPALVRAKWEAGKLDLIGGEYAETCSQLLSIDSAIHDLNRGRQAYQRLFERTPTTWGRRRYGVGPNVPQLLKRFGFDSSLHFVMDDGLYPDDEYSKLLWQGSDGSSVPSFSRIPLAGDSSAAWLRFASRMGESMDHDHVAGLAIARWPELRWPWLDDFRRAAKYAPALGKFVTFRQFFDETNLDGRMSEFRHGTYLSPFLVQAVARQEPAPLGRYIDYWQRQRSFEGIAWCRAMDDLIRRGTVTDSVSALQDRVEAAGPDRSNAVPDAAASEPSIDVELANEQQAAVQSLASAFQPAAGSKQPGVLVFNPLAFAREGVIEWPQSLAVPAAAGAVVARQFDSTRRQIVVKSPPCGYVWIPAGDGESPPRGSEKVPNAEGLVVRNEFFEASLSDKSGGLAQIRSHGRTSNRLSQQLAWRFPREKMLPATAERETTKTWYSEMRLRESRVVCNGPALGEVEAIGDLIDPATGETLATFRQTLRAWRGRRYLELDIELGVEKAPAGDPWTNYVAARFAWRDESLALTRSLQGTAVPIKDEQRIESAGFLELAGEDQRTTLLTGGLTFHRLTSPRMLDTLLVTEGEARRKFQFRIVLDHSYPEEAALDAETPLLVSEPISGPPAAGTAGWLLRTSVRSVQIRRVLPCAAVDPGALTTRGCIVRLQETEGKSCRLSLGAFLPIAQARQVDLRGQPLHTFRIEEGQALVAIAPYEVCDVELRFS